MLKKFWRAYGVTIILFIIIAFCVWFGYCVGHTAAETEAERATTTPVAGVNITPIEKAQCSPVESEETTVPEYIILTVTATAYDKCKNCCGKSDGITATGTQATAGRTIAVDPDVIPYGSEVIINGHTYIAEDSGGAVKGNRIDIFFDTHAEALEFGRQTLVASIRR